MPSLVFNHAGSNSRWFCHGLGRDSSISSSHTRFTFHQDTESSIDPPFYLSEFEIKYYLCHLLIALDALHSIGIMHRDVKPRNILINRTWQPFGFNAKKRNNPFQNIRTVDKRNGIPSVQEPVPLVLIDFGLADFYLPNKAYNVRVASRHYKAPELLLGYEYYDYGIDMWGVGCIMAGLLFRREPFFRGKDNKDQLSKIVSVLGSADLLTYCEKYGIKISPHIEIILSSYDNGKRTSWLSFYHNGNLQNCPIPSMSAIDLLDKLLVYDHEKRLSAKEALSHIFFEEVRELVETEVRMMQ
jgi:casein kinase II subunit alpha